MERRRRPAASQGIASTTVLIYTALGQSRLFIKIAGVGTIYSLVCFYATPPYRFAFSLASCSSICLLQLESTLASVGY